MYVSNMQHSDRTGPLRPVIFIATIIRSHHHRRQYCNGCALVSSARAFCSCYLQRGHAEKCETARTTDFPTLRHVVGIGRWCSQLTRPRRPQRHRRKTKRPTWPRHIGRGVGAFLFPQRKRDSGTSPQKAVTRRLTLACRTGRPPSRNGRVGTR